MVHRTDGTPAVYGADTIAAVSTAQGEGGIGVIRLSGPDAVAIACRLFRRTQGQPLTSPTPFRQYYGHIVDPASGAIVDEVLLTAMRAPRSYTREDMAEISAHGGPLPLQTILALACREGARLAQPGEFTQRAFLNGRIDLTQAEAVLDTIRARTDAGLRAAQNRLQGGLAAHVRALRARLVDLLAALEAAIDFADEDLTFLTPPEIAVELAAVREQVDTLVASYGHGRLLREGAATVIIGRPNTGKSSLLNALLRESRAIVTDVPGTTRDLIEEQVQIGGIPLRLVDTAGIRPTDDAVERIGVERSRSSLAQADLVLLVLDGAAPLTAEDRALLAEVAGHTAIIVINKADLPACVRPEDLHVPSGTPIISLSAATGSGLPQLEQAIERTLLGTSVASESLAIASLRQREAAEEALWALADAQATMKTGGTEELLAVDLSTALSALGRLTGEDVSEDVVHSLFARFCVGK